MGRLSDSPTETGTWQITPRFTEKARPIGSDPVPLRTVWSRLAATDGNGQTHGWMRAAGYFLATAISMRPTYAPSRPVIFLHSGHGSKVVAPCLHLWVGGLQRVQSSRD